MLPKATQLLTVLAGFEISPIAFSLLLLKEYDYIGQNTRDSNRITGSIGGSIDGEGSLNVHIVQLSARTCGGLTYSG